MTDALKHEPESVPELRAQLQTLGLWIAEALPTLDTVEPECSTEAELLTALIRRGEMLVLAALSRSASPAAQALTECKDNDSPWLVCKPCAAAGKCARAAVTEAMVTAYLMANDAYWERVDAEPTKLGKWRNGTPSEATRVSLAAALQAAQQEPAQADARDALPPVEGDVLPPIGSTVLIHLASSCKWVPHTVVGYYVWPNHGLVQSVFRVFVRVRSADGYLNARCLQDIRYPDDAAQAKPAGGAK